MTITTKAGLDAAQKTRIQVQFNLTVNNGSTIWKSLQWAGASAAVVEGKTLTNPPTLAAGWNALSNGMAAMNFIDYAAVNSHICAINCATGVIATQGTLCAIYDMVAAYNGLDQTLITAQAIGTNPTLTRPNVSGDGLELFLFQAAVTGAPGAGTTVTASYTNSGGTAGRTASLLLGGTSLIGLQGALIPFALQAGDKGVQSVQSVTLSASQGGAGTVWVVLGRRICDFDMAVNPSVENNLDYIALGLPEIGSDAALIIVATSAGTAGPTNQMIELVLAHG